MGSFTYSIALYLDNQLLLVHQFSIMVTQPSIYALGMKHFTERVLLGPALKLTRFNSSKGCIFVHNSKKTLGEHKKN